MDKEYWLVAAVALLILASVLDSFAGAVNLSVGNNPFSFLTVSSLATYPFTAVALGVRSLGLFVLILTAFSTIERQYVIKMLGALLLGVLAELYTVQQLATGSAVTPLNWTLSFAYAGVLLAPAFAYYLFRAALSGISGIPEEPVGESEKRIEKMKNLSEDKEQES